jgi:hypothetical protein
MKIIENIEQGTEEWLNLRIGKITGSNFDKIITRTGEYSKQANDFALQLASEIFFGFQEENYKSADMERGNELEPLARQAYEEFTLNAVKTVSFIDCGDYGCSPDGLVENDGLIEIKCPKAKNHFKYIYDNQIPYEYYAQCQGALMCSGREWIDFISFHPSVKSEHKLFIKRAYRDEEFIEKLKFYIDLTIKKRNDYLNIDAKTEINNTNDFQINEIKENESIDNRNFIELNDKNIVLDIEKYHELEPLSTQFDKIKKSLTSKAEAIHLANNVNLIKIGNSILEISYTVPKTYDEKLIDKKIDSTKEDLENALNLQIGMPVSTPKFKCKIIKS